MEVKSFVNQVLARLKGDDDKVIAERNHRKAVSAVKGQISSLESKELDCEIAVEEAKENLNEAKYPTTLIKDASDYIARIARKQEALDEAEEKLQSVKDSLSYFKTLQTEFNK